MGELLVPIMLLVLPPAVVIVPRLVKKWPHLTRLARAGAAASYAPPDPEKFNCRIRLIAQNESEKSLAAFAVEICGSIHAPCDMHPATLRLSVDDLTERLKKPAPVYSTVKDWCSPDSPRFSFSADIGKLPTRATNLPDWTSVATISPDWLQFPRRGKRSLQFNAAIVSAQDGAELASTTCLFTCDNQELGYLDIRENIERARTLGVALAFAVASADSPLDDCEVAVIESWAAENITAADMAHRARRKLTKAMTQAVNFFRGGNRIDIPQTCTQIVELAPPAERYDIIELCLCVSRATGSVTTEELTLLKGLAHWLKLDKNRFREMFERILPVGMHQFSDMEVTLGVTVEMDREMTRLQLNREYSKWNARVTNADPEIQSQADKMLKLIAEARSEYVS